MAVLAPLSGCAHQPTPSLSPDAACCATAERQPAWLVALAEPVAPVLGRVIGSLAWRKGYLASPALHAEIVSKLRPLDVVFVSSKGRLSGHTIPGLFQHAAIYLGTEAQLRALGMWSHEAVRPHHDAIRDGSVFIEADMKGVHLSPASVVLNVDRMVAARPHIATPGWKRRAVGTLFGHLGQPFDFWFDASRSERVFCTELVCHAMPELRLPRDALYGRQTILPDRVVHAVAQGRSRLVFHRYVVADPSGRRDESQAALAADLRGAWSDQSSTRGSGGKPPPVIARAAGTGDNVVQD